MMAPAANPTAIPAGSHSQNCVSALMTTPITMPMTMPTMICFRRAPGSVSLMGPTIPRPSEGLARPASRSGHFLRVLPLRTRSS